MFRLRLILLISLLATAFSGSALSLSLDSIAEWGRFPRFCINTYRWGCDFFNGYDTTYVHGTGHPFNIKARTESWTDFYHFRLDNTAEISMISDPSTSLGFYLTYLAVSAGYDMNVSKYFGGSDQVRRRWNFQFNCMLFRAELYFISNDVGSRITGFRPPHGSRKHENIEFKGINNSEWGLELSYYLTHKRYSAAAAFSFSRVQIKSGGSFFIGLCYNSQDYKFDFNDVTDDIKYYLPDTWEGYTYGIRNHNYLFKVGYGYNWVFKPRLVLGVSEAPMLGFTKGFISNNETSATTFALQNNFQLSLVYNNGRWFAGAVGTLQASLIRNNVRSLLSAYLTFDVSVGYRFSLW